MRLGKPKAAEYLNITLPGLDFASIFCFAWKGVLLVIEQKTNFFERNPSKTQEIQKATLDFWCWSLPLVVKVVHFIPPKEIVSSVSGELPSFFEFEQWNLTPLTWLQRWCLFCNLLGGKKWLQLAKRLQVQEKSMKHYIKPWSGSLFTITNLD